MNVKINYRPFLSVLLALFVLPGSGQAFVTAIAPHGAGNGVSCTDCHPNHLGAATPCVICHTNNTGGGYSKNSAPLVNTHMSLECTTCHTPHSSPQCGTPLAAGSFSGFTTSGATTTFTISSLNPTSPDWGNPARWPSKSGPERGVIFLVRNGLWNPDSQSFIDFTAEVAAADASSITVTGTHAAGNLTGSQDFYLLYGQMMRSSINGKSVLFSGPATFAVSDGLAAGGRDSTPDGVCQVCHSQTDYWRADGTGTNHNGSLVCTSCHAHRNGFQADCNLCHNYPPRVGPGDSHGRHTLLGYGCDTCHYETIPAGVVGPTHNNGTINVTPGPTFPGRPADGTRPLTFSYSPPANGIGPGSCAGNSCHAYWGFSDPVTWVINSNVVVIAQISGLHAQDADRTLDFAADRSSCYELVNNQPEERLCGYTWDFGGAGSIVGGNGEDRITYQYDATGAYAAAVTVTEPLTGISDRKSTIVNAEIVEPPPASADFAAVITGKTVTLTASLPADIARIYVYWGDRARTTYTTSNSEMKHTYTLGGRSYDIRVVTMDSHHNEVNYTSAEDPDLTVAIP
ncbi:MAG: hypothetical protein HY885_10820 [Deltaproteobacteria bacterium]|nr:hypothetical protein [Deltaproteobacteria bacterium]